jgi:NAD(P)-dependent dehydrogenase (short-subunit alcohol dehydrogenase family)
MYLWIMPLTVLITGATRGIGLETALQLARLGHTVVATGRQEDRLRKALEALKNTGREPVGLRMDVSSEKSIHKAAGQAAEMKLQLDVLVSNAGFLDPHDTSLLRDEERILADSMLTNSLGPLRVARAFLPLMRKPSRIIHVTSGGGSMSEPVGGWAPAYCTSKTLLNALTRHMAAELRSRRVSVNGVCPGWVRTAMGGAGAPLSVADGADTIVWLATLEHDPGTGKCFRGREEIPW